MRCGDSHVQPAARTLQTFPSSPAGLTCPGVPQGRWALRASRSRRDLFSASSKALDISAQVRINASMIQQSCQLLQHFQHILDIAVNSPDSSLMLAKLSQRPGFFLVHFFPEHILRTLTRRTSQITLNSGLSGRQRHKANPTPMPSGAGPVSPARRQDARVMHGRPRGLASRRPRLATKSMPEAHDRRNPSVERLFSGEILAHRTF